eukprot:6488106-Amphidinium_carterae.1
MHTNFNAHHNSNNRKTNLVLTIFCKHHVYYSSIVARSMKKSDASTIVTINNYKVDNAPTGLACYSRLSPGPFPYSMTLEEFYDILVLCQGGTFCAILECFPQPSVLLLQVLFAWCQVYNPMGGPHLNESFA